MNCPRCDTPLPAESKFCLSCGTNVSGDTGAAEPQPLEMGPDVEQTLRAELSGQFRIERELGRGGMGAVFLATELQLDRKVAIKVLPPSFTFGEGAVERFKREAKTSATLDHPHVIPIYRVSERATLLWYAMKYIEGETLTDLLEREKTLSFGRAADIVRQVADALQYAHDKGVFHRDIKPGNILIGRDGWVVVTDFGIAKVTSAASITGSGSMLGTPHYMSPEQCSGVPLSPAADQYSLAVMAYQMVAGELPFGGVSAVDVIKKHCFDPVPPIVGLRAETPSDLVAVVERGLGKKPEERFPSVRHFADAFGRAARGESLSAATVSGPVTPRPAVTEGQAPPRRGRMGLLIGAVAVVIAIVAVVMLSKGGTGGGATPAAGAAAESASTTPAPVATPVAPQPTGSALLVLRGAPPGASIRLDGRPASNPVVLEPGRRQTVVVTAQGFRPWQFALTPNAGDTVRQNVRLDRDTATVTAAAVPATPAGQAGYISIGSRPNAPMTINGRAAPANPVSDYEVPAGLIAIRFTVTDSLGTWTKDTTIAVGPGEHKIVGRVRLVRP